MKEKMTKRKDGRYQLSKTINGKRMFFYGKSSFEVMSKYNDCVENINKDTGKLGKELVFWLKTYKYGKIKMSSYDALESKYLYHVKDTWIDSMQIKKITGDDIQRFIDEKSFDVNNPISPTTVKRIKELLSGFFRYAYANKMIMSEPVKCVKLPKEENMLRKVKKPSEIPEEALKKILDRIDKKRYNIMIMFLLSTGLRIGEFIVLGWTDVDLEKRLIRINKTRTEVRNRDGKELSGGRSYMISTTKTTAGDRFVPMNDLAIKCVEKMIEDNKNRNIKSDYVFSTESGTICRPRNIQRAFDAEMIRNGFDHYNLHCLRHTFGSRLLRKGVDIKVVSSILGHTKIETTYDIYIHIIEEQKMSAVKMLDVI